MTAGFKTFKPVPLEVREAQIRAAHECMRDFERELRRLLPNIERIGGEIIAPDSPTARRVFEELTKKYFPNEGSQ